MIKGISDIRRLPRLGKIRLGEKATSKKTGAEYPRALDYFNCPDEVQAIFGEKPRELEIMFPVEDPTIIFPQWLKRYGSGKGLVCKGNGETAVETRDDGEMYEIECNPDECEAYQKKHCRRVASLQFMLLTVPGFGVYQIDTTSFHSIVNLNSCFTMLRGLCGRLAGIPLVLRLEAKEVTVDGKKKVVHVMSLTSRQTITQLQATARRLAIPGNVEVDKPDDDKPDDLYPASMSNPPDGDGGNGGNAVDSEAVEAAEEETNKKAKETEAKVEAGKKNGVENLF